MINSRQSLSCTIIVPIRRVGFHLEESDTLKNYFRSLLTADCEIVVVDGSPDSVFESHSKLWTDFTRHIKPDSKFRFLNGKVNGIHTGVEVASCEKIIVADDDIRYSVSDVRRMCKLLNESEVVRPQNFISPAPIWARLENARILINRGVLRAGDYPGTCAFRRSTMLRVGPYDGDVLFDNEEIIRHFALQGATINYAVDFFILKRPPTLTKWLEQRPRQAYEDFGMRFKTTLFMSLLPILLTLLVLGKLRAAIIFAGITSLASIAIAAKGLLRTKAFKVFAVHTPVYAPLWIVERSISVYWALYWRVRYGGYPFGDKLISKGTGVAWVEGAKAQPAGIGPAWTTNLGND